MKKLFIIALLLVAVGALFAEVYFNDTFDTNPTVAPGEWTFANGGTNNWVWGPPPTPALPVGGTPNTPNCVYITTNPAGTPPPWTYTDYSRDYFWRNITLPANAINVTLEFRWVAKGEGSYDWTKVFLLPTETVLTGLSGTSAHSDPAHPGYSSSIVEPGQLHSTPIYYNQSSGTVQWTTTTLPIPANQIAGQTKKLAFVWRSDVSGSGDNYAPPMGIDYVKITYDEAADEPSPATVVAPANGATMVATTTAFTWAPAVEGAQPTGYKFRHGTTNPPPAASEVTLANITTYTPPTSLAGSTQYYWQVIPFNTLGEATDCPVWSFTTAPAGMAEVEIGSPESTLYNYPINYFYRSSLSQTILTAADMGIGGGAITRLSYLFTRGSTNFPPAGGAFVTFYLANLPAGTTEFGNTTFLPAADFTQVWFGSLPVQTAGTYWVDIDLDTPFAYEGGNLGIMAYREFDPNPYYGSDNVWARSASGTRYATLYGQSDSAGLTPTTPPSGTRHQFVNHMKISLVTAGMGHLNGTVTSGGNPLPDVVVSINGTARTGETNAMGQYNIGYLPEGPFTLTASKHTYENYISPSLTIVEDETLTHDFSMNLSAAITVSGTLDLSDTGAPAVGAEISLTGYQDYFGITSVAGGNFSIPGVFTGHTYELKVVYTGYQTYIGEVTVPGGSGNVTLPLITLAEKAYPVRNVVAVDNAPANATITWEEPVEGEDIWFTLSTDSINDSAGLTAGGWYETANRFNAAMLSALGVAGATLTEFAFHAPVAASNIPPSGYEARVYAGGQGLTDLGPLVTSQAIPAADVTPNAWNYVTFDTEAEIPTNAELFIVLYSNHPATYYPHAVCQGAYTDGFGNIRRYNDYSMDFAATSAFGGNFMIQAMASGAEGPRAFSLEQYYASLETAENLTTYNFPTDVPYAPLDRVAGSIDTAKKDGPETYEWTPNMSKAAQATPQLYWSRRDGGQTIINDTRVLTHYNLYLTSLDNMGDEGEWAGIATGITGLSYVDNNWPGYDQPEAYRYAVRAVYTGGVLSQPRFSNIVDIGMSVPVSITLTAPNTLPVNGGTLRLVNHDGNPLHVYNIYSGTNIYTHNSVWRGTYTVTLTHSDYSYTNASFLVDANPTTASFTVTPVIYAGDPSSSLVSYMHPITNYYNQSINQTIYPAEVFPMAANITEMSLNLATSSGAITAPIMIYMANTTLDDLNGGWIPLASFTQVYSGNFTTTAGVHNFVFQTPFNYTGGNLAVLTRKITTGVTNYNQSSWQVTNAHAGIGRYYNTDNHDDLSNPANWQAGTTVNFFGNTSFGMNLGAYGMISGAVTTGGAPLSGVRVQVNGTNNYNITDAAGLYTLNYVAAGTRTITATKHTYSDYTSGNLTVTNGQVTTQNITMTLRPQVTVTGTVIGSDTQAGLGGCSIYLTGYEPYTGISAANGTFTIPGVFANFTYTIRITREGYSTYTDENISVLGANLNVGTITLMEKANKPRNVVATPNATTFNVGVTWEEPTDGDEYWFGLSDDNYNDSIGTGGAADFHIAHRYTPAMLEQFGIAGATMTQAAFVPNYHNVATWEFKIWTGGSGYPRDPGTPAYTQTLSSPTLVDMEWNEFTLTTPFTIPDGTEFWMGFRIITASNHPAGCDAGPPLATFADVMEWNGDWITMNEAGGGSLPYNWLIKGFVEDGQGIERSFSLGDLVGDPYVAPTTGTNLDPRKGSSSPIAAFSAGNTGGNSIYTDKYITPYRKLDHEVVPNDSRVLTGYNVYRLLAEHMGTPAEWDLLTQNTSNTAYTHNNGLAEGQGIYHYAVRAVYTNNNLSDPAVSNYVVVGGTEVLIMITAPGGASAAGAIVSLVNNSNATFSYNGTADGTNMIAFSGVPAGNYTLRVNARHLGFANYLNDNLTIAGDNQVIPVSLAQSDIVMEEGFEETTGFNLPTGWTKVGPHTGGYGWRSADPSQFTGAYPTGCDLNSAATPHGGARFGMRGYPYSSPDAWMFSSGFHLEAGRPVEVTFFYMAPGWESLFEYDDFEVRIGQTATATGMATAELVLLYMNTNYPGPTTYNTWSEAYHEFTPTATGTYYLGFHDLTSYDVGFFIMIDDIEVNQPVGENNPEIVLPKVTALKSNYPNPFNPSTTIAFDKAKDGNVRVEIYNVKGQKVTTLVNDLYKAGNHTVEWNGTDDSDTPVSSGVYFYRLTTEEVTATRKMMLMK